MLGCLSSYSCTIQVIMFPTLSSQLGCTIHFAAHAQEGCKTKRQLMKKLDFVGLCIRKPARSSDLSILSSSSENEKCKVALSTYGPRRSSK